MEPIVNSSEPQTSASQSRAVDVADPELVASLGARLGPAATFATTEHFNLQTARAITVSEANGRASIYLAVLSSNLIALAFIGQMSRLGTAFYAFALILLPVLAFVGVVTFLRLVQSSLEDIAYARRIGMLRNFYLRLAPELEPFIVVIRGTDSAPV
jgi:RsiW-degrading membrane proteinase PrsW (M82 family)